MEVAVTSSRLEMKWRWQLPPVGWGRLGMKLEGSVSPPRVISTAATATPTAAPSPNWTAPSSWWTPTP